VLPSSPEQPYLQIGLKGGGVIRTNLVGSYNADNVMAAIAVGMHFGLTFEEACTAIAAYVPSNNRSQMTATERNTLIVDAYNANPTSMDAALTNFSNVRAAVKIALLGDMLELGEESYEEHVTVIKKALESDLETVCFVGTEFGKALDSVPESAKVKWFVDSQSLADWLAQQNVSGATILIKGSRGTRMEKTIASL
jgi:UDP-N-acetylmuramoyl-tripeptide--D-alanyl-D-alanine ligase